MKGDLQENVVKVKKTGQLNTTENELFLETTVLLPLVICN